MPKIRKTCYPIRGLADKPPYNGVEQIFNQTVNITAGQFFNLLDTSVKQMAFSLQRCTPRHQVKKTKKLLTDDKNVINKSLVSSAMAKVTTGSPVITSQTHHDDGGSQPVMMTAYVNNLQMPKTLLDDDYIVKLISWSLIKMMSP